MEETKQTRNQREIRSVARLAAWTFAWMVTLALARFGPDLLWDSQPVVSWIAIAANVLVGIGWVVAHASFLRGVDDLQRKIMLDAIAAALGVGLVGGFAYAVASSAGLIAVDANVAFFSILMGLVYLVAIAIGNLRYR